MKLLKLARVWRWLLIAILIAQCALLASDILGGHLLLAIVPVVLIPGSVYGLVLNRRTIANIIEQNRPRADYARIAALRSDTLPDVAAGRGGASIAFEGAKLRVRTGPGGGITPNSLSDVAIGDIAADDQGWQTVGILPEGH